MSATHLTTDCGSGGQLRHRAALEALGDATEWAFATWREWRRRSQQRAELAALDPQMLRDIGITEAERAVLANKPFWRA